MVLHKFPLLLSALVVAGWYATGGGRLRAVVVGAGDGFDGSYYHHHDGSWRRVICPQTASVCGLQNIHQWRDEKHRLTPRSHVMYRRGDKWTLSLYRGPPVFTATQAPNTKTAFGSDAVYPPSSGWEELRPVQESGEAPPRRKRARGVPLNKSVRVSIHGWFTPHPAQPHTEADSPLLGHLVERPATSLLIGFNLLCAYWLFAYSQRHGESAAVEAVAVQYDRTVRHGEYWRLISASFSHLSILHLAFNMSSLYNIGSIEAPFVVGPIVYFVQSLMLVPTVMAVTLLVYGLVIHCKGDSDLARRYAMGYGVGYSGVLFAWVTVAANLMPEFCPVPGLTRLCFRTRPLLGVSWLPVNLGPFVLLLLASLLMRNASFIGHLAGIACGYIIGWSRGTSSSWVTLEPTLLGRAALLVVLVLEGRVKPAARALAQRFQLDGIRAGDRDRGHSSSASARGARSTAAVLPVVEAGTAVEASVEEEENDSRPPGRRSGLIASCAAIFAGTEEAVLVGSMIVAVALRAVLLSGVHSHSMSAVGLLACLSELLGIFVVALCLGAGDGAGGAVEALTEDASGADEAEGAQVKRTRQWGRGRAYACILLVLECLSGGLLIGTLLAGAQCSNGEVSFTTMSLGVGLAVVPAAARALLLRVVLTTLQPEHLADTPVLCRAIGAVHGIVLPRDPGDYFDEAQTHTPFGGAGHVLGRRDLSGRAGMRLSSSNARDTPSV